MANHQRNETTEDRLLRERKQREHERDYTDPEKQFVRKHAWLPAAQDRLQRVRDTGREYLKYFTLCAEKAIDVRLFWVENLVEFDERGYPNVVFCEHFADQYELITASLRRTRGFLADFEDLVLDRNSPQSRDFYSTLPFDVYNLDFTGVCFATTEPPFSKTLDAIVTLVDESARLPDKQGFDMLLTFRAQRSEENQEAIRALKDNVRENRRGHGWFNEVFLASYGDDLGQLLHRYHEFLLLTLPKLLGRFGADAGFQVACTHRLYYPRPSVQNTQYHIISFGLSFDWVGRDTGLSRTVRQRVPRQEIITDAYFGMMRRLITQNITNVGAARFARDQYKQDVQALLALVEEV